MPKQLSIFDDYDHDDVCSEYFVVNYSDCNRPFATDECDIGKPCPLCQDIGRGIKINHVKRRNPRTHEKQAIQANPAQE